MKTFHYITKDGEGWIKLDNPFRKMLAEHEWKEFESNNPPIKWVGDKLPEETVLSEEQLDFPWQCLLKDSLYSYLEWVDCLNENDAMASKKLGATVRQAARLKSQLTQKTTDMSKNISEQRVIINQKAADNNTWLAPYCGKLATLTAYRDGDLEILIDGETEPLDALGGFVASNDWHYTIHDIVDKVDGESQLTQREEESEYYILKDGDQILVGDQWSSDFGETWGTVLTDFEETFDSSVHHKHRRKIQPNREQGEAEQREETFNRDHVIDAFESGFHNGQLEAGRQTVSLIDNGEDYLKTVKPSPSPVISQPVTSFLAVLEENYEATKSKYAPDIINEKTALEAVQETYEDLIAIYKSKFI